jgi:hypothetical protein
MPRRSIGLLAALALLVGCGNQGPSPAHSAGETVVWAVGDGADGSAAGERLADYIVQQRPQRFFYLGDVYQDGTASEFADHYAPFYGGLAGRTDPVVGNHEYASRASGYEPYWHQERGWSAETAQHRAYVDAASGWQVIAYSSETDPTSEAEWIGRQVTRHSGTCRIAFGHRGRYVVADELHTDNVDQSPIWSQLAGRTAINLIAHDHLYGRLAPIDGVTVLLSGAGGHDLRGLGEQLHPVAATHAGVPTATRLVLRRGAADFRQVDADGNVYDSGTIRCKPAGG